MEKRIAAVAETRNRIVEATVQLHDEKGVSATTMQDIAARAGVALGTVYRHFATVDQLIPACGARILEQNPPPTAAVFEGITSPVERYEALLRALYGFYSRGEHRFEVGLMESRNFEVMAQFMGEAIANIQRLVALALDGTSDDAGRAGSAFADFRTWQAFKGAGFDNEETVEVAVSVLRSELHNVFESEGSK
jgi:AcrR family transcriptional regulator